MATDRRLSFSKKWFQRAERSKDPFDKFFSLWIALIVSAQRLRTKYGSYGDERDTDREKILDYFRHNVTPISEVLVGHRDEMAMLARRRGSYYRNPIIDTGNPELQNKFSRLSKHYTEEEEILQEELVETFAEILNKVRNNVFHGTKVYDDHEDIRLLESMNPIFAEIIGKCEGFMID